MKIAYGITTSRWGGAQQYVYELILDRLKRKDEVFLIVGEAGELTRRLSEKNIKIYILPELVRNINPVKDFLAILKFRKLLNHISPDIVHLNSSKAGVIGRIAAVKLKKIKTVFTVHGWAFSEGVPSNFKRIIYVYIERIMSKLTDLIICVSQYDYNLAIKCNVIRDRENAIVIHNGVKKNDYSEMRSVHKPVKLVMIARFSTQKDQAMLIRCLSRVDRNLFTITFVGDGDTLEDNVKLVKSLKLQDNVNFVGFKKNVSLYLKESDIYILTTHYEGLPISIIEAMSYGLPIVASDVGGNRELITNNGFLVSNEDDLLKVINVLLINTDQIVKMGKQSRENFLQNYTLETCLDKTNAQYNILNSMKKV